MKLMVYFGYEYSSLAPGFYDNAEDYLIRTPDGSFTGGWQRKPWQRDFMVCYGGNYSDEMIKRVEHVKKLYEAIHKRGGVLDTHQSSCCIMPTLSFCDSYYDGENIQALLKNNPEIMTPDSFKAEFFGYNLGIPCNFIAYSSEGYPMSYPAGFSLVHNVFPRPSQRWDLPYMSGIWKIFDEYELGDAEWTPYFKNQKITASDAMVSLYEGKNTVAVIYDVLPGRENLSLSAEGFSKVTDLLYGGEYEVKDGVAELPAKTRALQMYLLEE